MCQSLLADAAYKKLPRSAKSNFAPAAKRVKELIEEAQPKLAEEHPEKLSFCLQANHERSAFLPTGTVKNS